MKIWLHINGVQEGPFDEDQLPLDRMTPDTPVWYDGLPGWLAASEAEVTARILAQASQPVEEPQCQEPQYQEPQCQEPQCQEPQYHEPQPAYVPQQPYGAQYAYGAQAYASQPVRPQRPERAPTYLVWSLLLTLLCCNPIGIVAIIMGAGVSSRLRAHDFEGAKRQSVTTEWWLIITIVTSLILLPFSFMMLFI